MGKAPHGTGRGGKYHMLLKAEFRFHSSRQRASVAPGASASSNGSVEEPARKAERDSVSFRRCFGAVRLFHCVTSSVPERGDAAVPPSERRDPHALVSADGRTEHSVFSQTPTATVYRCEDVDGGLEPF